MKSLVLNGPARPCARTMRGAVITRGWSRRSRRKRWAGLIVLAALLAAPGAAFAKKLVITEAIEITGKIQRPQAMYILQRSKLNLKGLDLRRSLIPKLLESMRKPPL